MGKAKLIVFDELAKFFKDHGFSLYMVGGTSRDFLLERVINDYDLATNATPHDMEKFLPNANYRFAEFGTVSVKHHEQKVEITTLRVEGKYLDYRHPGSITFVNNPEEDYRRRDFTINALYIDQDYKVYDYASGLSDLESATLRMIGDPYVRLVEDPLRILRALRFVVVLSLKFDPLLEKALFDNSHLVSRLNRDKILMESKKVGGENQEKLKKLYEVFNINLS